MKSSTITDERFEKGWFAAQTLGKEEEAWYYYGTVQYEDFARDSTASTSERGNTVVGPQKIQIWAVDLLQNAKFFHGRVHSK